MAVLDAAEHGLNLALHYPTAAIGDRLVQKAQGIAHATVGGAGDVFQGPGLGTDIFLTENPFQIFADHFRRQAFEIELQAA